MSDSKQKAKYSRDWIISKGYKSDIFDLNKIINSDEFIVRSSDKSPYEYNVRGYRVFGCEGHYYCECPDFEEKPKNCKHIIALRKYLKDPYFEKIRNSSAVLTLPDSAPIDEKFENIVEQLKKKYAGKDVYSKAEIMAENPLLEFKKLDSWSKKVTGHTFLQYLTSCGIVKEVKTFETPVNNAVSREDLAGKRVCIVTDTDESGTPYYRSWMANTVDVSPGVFERAGATVVPFDSEKIDYVCFNFYRPIQKEPEDANKAAFSVLDRLEKGQLAFLMIDRSNLSKLKSEDINSRRYSPEERAELGLKVYSEYQSEEDCADDGIQIENAVSFDSLPKIDKDEIYWTLKELHSWFGESEIRSTRTKDYSSSKDGYDDIETVGKELSVYEALCKSISNPAVEKYIKDRAEKKKDGTLHKGRIQLVAAFRYTCRTDSYYAIVAKNVDSHTIRVTQEQRWMRNVGDFDYEWDYKLTKDYFDGIDPTLIYCMKNKNNDASFEYRNRTGYVYIDSDSGIIPFRAFADDSAIEYVEFSNNVREIESYAFENCINLKSVKLGENVYSIGSGAFSGCVSLGSAVLRGKLRKIGNRCFYGCSGLKMVVFDDDSICDSIGKDVFSGCDSLLKDDLPSFLITDYN